VITITSDNAISTAQFTLSIQIVDGVDGPITVAATVALAVSSTISLNSISLNTIAVGYWPQHHRCRRC